MELTEFTGNETGPYEDPRDNYWYYNYLNPAEQHLMWMYLWKQQHKEIQQDLKDLGLPTHTEDYTRGFLAAVSLQSSNSVSLNIFEMEEEVEKYVKEIMSSN